MGSKPITRQYPSTLEARSRTPPPRPRGAKPERSAESKMVKAIQGRRTDCVGAPRGDRSSNSCSNGPRLGIDLSESKETAYERNRQDQEQGAGREGSDEEVRGSRHPRPIARGRGQGRPGFRKPQAERRERQGRLQEVVVSSAANLSPCHKGSDRCNPVWSVCAPPPLSELSEPTTSTTVPNGRSSRPGRKRVLHPPAALDLTRSSGGCWGAWWTTMLATAASTDLSGGGKLSNSPRRSATLPHGQAARCCRRRRASAPGCQRQRRVSAIGPRPVATKAAPVPHVIPVGGDFVEEGFDLSRVLGIILAPDGRRPGQPFWRRARSG